MLQIPETSTAQQWCYFVFMLVAVYPYVSMLRNTEVVREDRDFFHPDSLLQQVLFFFFMILSPLNFNSCFFSQQEWRS